MIFHPGRTGSCIMRPRRAVSCVLKLNPPARIGKKITLGQQLTPRSASLSFPEAPYVTVWALAFPVVRQNATWK